MPSFADGPPPQISTPPRPAIIRPATAELLRYGGDPVAAMLPGMVGAIARAQAFPVVEGRNTGSGVADTCAIPLPASIVAGDLLLLIIGYSDNSGAQSVSSAPSGFSELVNVVPSTTPLRRFLVYYKTPASGSEGASINITFSPGGGAFASTSYRVSGHGGIPEAASAQGASSGANPPDLAPTFSGKSLWIAATSHAVTTQTLTAPTNYSDMVQAVRTSSGDRPRTGSAERLLEAASENPGTFYAGTVSTWAAATVGVAGS